MTAGTLCLVVSYLMLCCNICRIQTRQGGQLMDKRLVVAIDGWDTDSMYPSGHYVRTLGVIGDRDVETVSTCRYKTVTFITLLLRCIWRKFVLQHTMSECKWCRSCIAWGVWVCCCAYQTLHDDARADPAVLVSNLLHAVTCCDDNAGCAADRERHQHRALLASRARVRAAAAVGSHRSGHCRPQQGGFAGPLHMQRGPAWLHGH